MGREIRMVPANWEHPIVDRHYGSRTEPGYQPMYDQTYQSACQEWKAAFAAWERGERPSYYRASEDGADCQYWEWEGGPPVRAYYRPWADEDATWLQVWETVSEGTPVTPPFATPEELVEYLVTHGDEWDQRRGHGGWERRNAEQFVKRGYAPSMAVTTTSTGAEIREPRDGMETAQ